MAVLLDPRSQKALTLATSASRWTRLPTGAFRIPSCSAPDQSYTVSPDLCQCEDDRRNPTSICKHRIAVSLVLALIETQPAPVVKRLPATLRED